MKQNLRFLMLTLLCAVFSTAWGQTEEVTDDLNLALTGVTGTSYADWSGKTSKSTAVYAGNSAGGNSSIQLRSNNSNSGIISTTSGGKVKKVVVTWNENTTNGRTLNVYGSNTAYFAASDLYITSNQGTLLGTIVYGTSTELTISGDYAYIGLRSNSGAMYLEEIDITWEPASSIPDVALPIFNPGEGTYTTAQSVTITCATEGATIYYTTNGNNPSSSSSVYSTPITISETTTLKAIAIKDGVSSSVASATYTIEIPATPITIAEARNQATGSVFTKGIVTSCVGKTAYIQDESAGICVYGDDNLNLTIGDEITVQGTLNTYNGLLEITSPTCTVISSDNSVNPVVKTIGEISNDIQGLLVKIENAKVTTIDDQNTTIEQEGNTIIVRGISGVDYAVGDLLSLTGNVGCYKTVQIVNPRDITITADITPSIVVNPTSYNVGWQEATGVIPVTCNNIDESESLDLQFYDEDGVTEIEFDEDWLIIEINEDNNIEYIIDENNGESRSVYLKVYAGEVYSDLITITQAAYVDQPIFYEGFTGSTGTLTDFGGGDGNGTIKYDESGWDVSNAYGADNAAKFGASKKKGSATTPELINLNGDAILTFKAAAWASEVSTITVSITGDNATISPSTFDLANGEWGEYTAYIHGGSSTSKITFTASENRFFLDEVTIEEFESETIPVTIGSTGYATLYYGNKNLVVPADVTAKTYKANGDKIAVSKTYTSGNVIPAGTGVVLEGSAGEYNFIVTTSAGEGDNNSNLYGLDKAGTTVAPGSGSYLFYKLSTNSAGEDVGFYYGADNGVAFTIPAHKAYLAIPTTPGQVSSFVFDETVGIDKVQKDALSAEGIYTLSGIRVNCDNLPKGIYIVNGKKIVIK